MSRDDVAALLMAWRASERVGIDHERVDARVEGVVQFRVRVLVDRATAAERWALYGAMIDELPAGIECEIVTTVDKR